MNLESLLIGLLVAAIVWLLMRHARAARRRRLGAPGPQGTMPRMGQPGTATPAQLERLQALSFEVSPHWSLEEAQLILNAVGYLRAVLRAVRGSGDAPVELQNELLVFILSDVALRERVTRWEEGDEPPRDACFARVAARIGG